MRVVTVIRSNGERTAALCESIVRKQCDDVTVISVEPFVAAVRRCFEIAIASGADWLLTVDADMLLFDNAVAEFTAAAARMPASVWQVQGQMSCRLYLGVRRCGPRLYRIAALPRALELLTDAVRPEAELTRALQGFQRVSLNTGRHDFEQWRRDLYRKGATHREKHPQWTHQAQCWATGDDDLRAAYDGWLGRPLSVAEVEPLG